MGVPRGPPKPTMSNQFQLMREKRFLPFFLTQFLGAFNDNVFKTALITLVAFRGAEFAGLGSAQLTTLLPGLFILPFFLFSATGGQVADKYDKGSVARVVKLCEIAIMLLAGWGFLAHSLWQLVLALVLMGLHSTFFGPVKYSYLPQHLAPQELVGGNGMVGMGTFVAILLGQVLGAGLIALDDSNRLASIGVLALAIAGWWASRGIPSSPPAEPGLKVNLNPFSETWRNIGFARSNRAVWLSVLGISWFWFYGATVLAQFPNLAKSALGGSESVFMLLLTVFSVGVGIGSLLCERLSRGRVEIGLVPLAAIGLTLFGTDMYFSIPDTPLMQNGGITEYLQHFTHWRLLFDIAALGLCGGLYVVPLNAMIQTRCDRRYVSRVIAAVNIMNAGFMVVSAGVSMVLLGLGLSIGELFLAVALFNAVVAIYIYTLLPEFLMRFIVWLLVHTVYRVRTQGVAHIPEGGAAVIVCNHVSFVDALVILAASPRPIRFVMDHRIFRIPVLNFVFRENRAIPIASAKEDPDTLHRAYDDIAAALAAGDLVGIFPEGRVTDSGEIAPFKGGINKILQRNPVPVVPMALRGLWGSFFSRKGGPAMSKPFRRGFFNRIELIVDAPMAPDSVSPAALQARIQTLRGEAA
ncbi:MAG: MFS transporter [Moraxellaceae bacterium]|nr:MFS transporter [Moraxellaceae bacterium]